MRIHNKKDPGHVEVKTNEERQKEIGMLSKEGPQGAEGEGSSAKRTGGSGKGQGKGQVGKPGITVPQVDTSAFAAAPMSKSVGGGGALEAPSILPTGGAEEGTAGGLHGDVAAASQLPISNRAAVTAGNPDLVANSTPLSNAVDALSDSLASGTTDDATLGQQIKAYSAAMDAAGAADQTVKGLKTMMTSAGLSGEGAKQVAKVASAAGVPLPAGAVGASIPTVAIATATLNGHLANSDTDPGIIELAVQGLRNAAQAEASSPAEADGLVGDAINAAIDETPATNNTGLAALYAAAAKAGVDISGEGEDKAAAAMNKKAINKDKPAKNHTVAEQPQQQQQSQQAQQAGGGGSNSGGGASGTGGGGGGGGDVSKTSSQAPTYDKEAANTPYGAKENLGAWTQQNLAKGTYNNEQQRYTSDGSNIVYGADGKSATITAKNEGNGNWSSARITGEPVGDLPKYLEATIACPSGKGTWPAFWVVGPGSWPQGGEIDVMEQVNGDGNLVSSNHWGATTPGSAGEMPPWGTNNSVSGLDMTQPHRYGVMITETGTQFYLDGKKIGNPESYPPEANFSKIAREMVPTINLAMGGTWPGDVPGDLSDQVMKVSSMTRSNKAPDET